MNPTNRDSDSESDLMERLAPSSGFPSDAPRARLAERADHDGLLDVAYAIADSPVGPLLVAATSRGLVRVAFEREGHDAVLSSLAASISQRILRAARRTDVVVRELDEYFAGRRRRFDVAVDLRLIKGFRRTVISHLSDIEYGATVTYMQLAAASGNPAAVRAAASACSHNPVPLVVPCHRVVRSNGTIGNYLGGIEAKAALLALEAASP